MLTLPDRKMVTILSLNQQKYLYLSVKRNQACAVGTQKKGLIEALPLSTRNKC